MLSSDVFRVQGSLYVISCLFVFCSFELGSGPANIRSPIRVNDGYAHTVQVTRLGRQGSLTIDDNLSYSTSGQSKGPLQSLNAGGNVFLGKNFLFTCCKLY